MKLERILIASDLSARADRALQRAALLAAQHRAELVALYVIAPLASAVPAEDWLWPTGLPPFHVSEAVHNSARQELEQRLAGLPPSATLQSRVMVCEGTPFVEIIRQARALEADLIVLGAHGEHFLRDLLLGTTAERVVRKGDRPVLLVKTPATEAYARVLAAVDFSAHALRALHGARILAPSSRFELLHVYDIWYEGKLRTGGMTEDEIQSVHKRYEQRARRELEEFATRGGLKPAGTDVRVQHGYPGTALAQAATDRHNDLVVLGTRGLSGLRHVLLGSVAAHVLREAPVDVLVVPPAKTDFELP